MIPREIFHATENGYYYKNQKAFDTGIGICYMPEWKFSDEYKLTYTRNEIEQIVRQWLNDTEQYVSEQQVTTLAEQVFNEIDWQCVETYLNDLEL